MKTHKLSQWSRLDNAAKIFPPNSQKSDTKVFRFACELTELIDETVLQLALDNTIEAFPLYKSIIKSGLFWYYLETSSIKPVVKIEDSPPCSSLYDKNHKTLLFRVTYYKNRINLEVYHALTDGTGALQFLKTLIYHYVTIKHSDVFKDKMPIMDYDASLTQKMDDSFQKYYTNSKGGIKKKRQVAYKIRGVKVAENRIKVTEGIMSVKSLTEIAHNYNTTLTIFISAVFMYSISEEMAVRHKKNPVVLSVPVNLRKYFYSESARNFFGVISIGYNFRDNSNELNDIISNISSQFKEKLTEEKLSQRINVLSSLEHNMLMRMIPLCIKDICLQIGNGVTDSENTCTVSNIGKIDMPNEIKPYISKFDVFISTSKLQMCICSYEDYLTLSFTSSFVSSDIQMRFFRTLTDMGVNIDIVTNKIDDE